MEQHILIVNDTTETNRLLENGWKVVSVTAQHIAGGSYAVAGGFLIVLERPTKNSDLNIEKL